MTLSAAVNNLNNIDTLLKGIKNGHSDGDFSAVLVKKTGTMGDVKSKAICKSNKVSGFKEYLSEATSEANVESSLNLTLAKDITEKIKDLESEEKTDAENVILFAQALETTNHEVTLGLEAQTEIADITETIAEAEVEVLEAKLNENDELSQEITLDEDMLQELNIEKISSETESSNDNSSLLNRQSAEEQGIKIALNQEVKPFELQTTQEVAKPVEITPSKIIEQVAKQLEGLQHTSKVDIVLNPESLGKVIIQLVKSPEGLSAQFTTATQEARNLLMKGLDGLKESLTAHGVGVDNVTVKVNDTQKSEYNADWTEQEGSRGGNKEQNPQNREEKEKGLFEKTIAQQEENGKV